MLMGAESKSSSSVDAVLMAALDHVAITERTPKLPPMEGVTAPFQRDEYVTRPFSPYDQLDIQTHDQLDIQIQTHDQIQKETETTAFTKPYSPYDIFEVRDQSAPVPTVVLVIPPEAPIAPKMITASKNLVANEFAEEETEVVYGPRTSTIAFVAFVALAAALAIGVLLVYAIT